MTHPKSRTSGFEIDSAAGRPVVTAPRLPPFALVIFGGAGDLTRRKIVPALYNLTLDGALPEALGVIGVARARLTADAFRESLREATELHSRRKPLEEAAWSRFAGAVDYSAGSFGDASTYDALRERLEVADRERGTSGNRIYYLATPPGEFPVILEGLYRSGLLRRATDGDGPWSRVVIEKPFGRDLASARALNELVARYLEESQTFRIDHYLGKETVQNILVLRFANAIFEPIWNRMHIDHVQITAAETIGVEGRGRFYDKTGVVRDIVQSHLLEVLALCAMEPPISFAADDVRDQKVHVLRALRPSWGSSALREVVHGQYRGYETEPGVASGSRTPTFVALKVMVDNGRWQGVPFYLRTGKRLASRRTEVAVHFRPIPLCLFPYAQECGIEPNVLVLAIQPDEGVSLRFVCKVPGEHVAAANVLMHMSYAETFGTPLGDAYERLLVDCARGDATLFARRDGVEAAWSFVTPLLDAWEASPQEVALYDAGSQGPIEASRLLERDGRGWRSLG